MGCLWIFDGTIQFSAGCLDASGIIRIDGLVKASTTDKSFHCHEKFVCQHVCGRFKVRCSRSASKEKYIAFSPAKYNSVTANGVEGSTWSAVKVASSSWPQALLVILHGKQVCRTFCMFSRATESPKHIQARIVQLGPLNGTIECGYDKSAIV